MAAEEILRFALFKEVLKPTRKKKRKLNNGVSAASDSDSDNEDDAPAGGDDEDAAEVAEAEKRMEMPAGAGAGSSPRKGKGRKPLTRRSASKGLSENGEEHATAEANADVAMKPVEDEDEDDELAEPTQGSQGPVAPERSVASPFTSSFRLLPRSLLLKHPLRLLTSLLLLVYLSLFLPPLQTRPFPNPPRPLPLRPC